MPDDDFLSDVWKVLTMHVGTSVADLELLQLRQLLITHGTCSDCRTLIAMPPLPAVVLLPAAAVAKFCTVSTAGVPAAPWSPSPSSWRSCRHGRPRPRAAGRNTSAQWLSGHDASPAEDAPASTESA